MAEPIWIDESLSSELPFLEGNRFLFFLAETLIEVLIYGGE